VTKQRKHEQRFQREFLGAYLISMREARSARTEILPFDLLGEDFLGWTQHSLSQLQTEGLKVRNSDDAFVHSVVSVRREAEDCVNGLIEAGQRGQPGKYVDIENPSDVLEITADHAGQFPFYFRIETKPGETRAVLVIQRTGRLSPISFFRSEWADEFRSRFAGYTLDIVPLTPGDLVERIARGKLLEVEILHHRAPSGLSGLLGEMADSFRVSTTIKPPRGERFPIVAGIRRLLEDLRDRSEVEMPEDIGGQLAMRFDFDGSRRTIFFGGSDFVEPFVEVDPDSLRRQQGGRITVESLHTAADRVTSDAWKELYRAGG